MGTTFQFDWEIVLISWCQNNFPSWLIEILKAVSNVGDTIFMFLLVVFLYLCFDKKLGKRVLINALVSLLFASEIKNLIKRRRPYFDNDVECLKIIDKKYGLYDLNGQGFSFPSMHSSNITTVMGTLYEYYRKNSLLLLSIIICLLVGVSRFALGCHYPTDVIVGWLVGILVSAIFGKFQDKVPIRKQYVFLIVLGLIGLPFCTSHDFYTTYGLLLGFVVCDVIDEKYTDFKNTKNILRMVIRSFVAVIPFLCITEGIKLIVPSYLLENIVIDNLVTVIRYFLGTIVGFGLTPFLYKYNILKIKE